MEAESVPGVSDDNVVEGRVPLAEACEAYFDNHVGVLLWFTMLLRAECIWIELIEGVFE